MGCMVTVIYALTISKQPTYSPGSVVLLAEGGCGWLSETWCILFRIKVLVKKTNSLKNCRLKEAEEDRGAKEVGLSPED